jgi:diacylglycerol kinase
VTADHSLYSFHAIFAALKEEDAVRSFYYAVICHFVCLGIGICSLS